MISPGTSAAGASHGRKVRQTPRRRLFSTRSISVAKFLFRTFEEGGLSKKTGRLPRDFLASCLGF